MKTLYKKATHLRAHTWKDIGGFGGVLLDGAFFVFLVMMSGIVMSVGAIAVVVAYLVRPLLTLLSLTPKSPEKDSDKVILLDNGTTGVRLPPMPEDAKPFGQVQTAKAKTETEATRP